MTPALAPERPLYPDQPGYGDPPAVHKVTRNNPKAVAAEPAQATILDLPGMSDAEFVKHRNDVMREAMRRIRAKRREAKSREG
jgi:hypothetical protein